MPLDKDFNYKATAKRFTPIGVLFFKLCPFEVAPKICFNHHFLIPGKRKRARRPSQTGAWARGVHSSAKRYARVDLTEKKKRKGARVSPRRALRRDSGGQG